MKKNTKQILLAVTLLGLVTNIFGQDNIKSESDTHIFWQPNRVLTSNDFKGDGNSNPKFIKYCNDLEFCTMASMGLCSVLDIPKKKRKRGELKEKAYFAPTFEKSTSYILWTGSSGIEKQKIVFDIYEISARFARQQLKQLQDSTCGYGLISIMFKPAQARAMEMRKSLVDSYIKDVYIDKRKGAYEEWREKIDKLLVDSEEFTTKPEDCYRFVKNEPIDKNYMMAKSVIEFY
jgi:hypothetical protein